MLGRRTALSDAGNKVARGCGLVWKVPAGLDAIQKGFSVNLTKSNGDASNELPVPGTFVLPADSRIAFSYAQACPSSTAVQAAARQRACPKSSAAGVSARKRRWGGR